MQMVIPFISVTSSQTVTPTLISLYEPPDHKSDQPNYYQSQYGAFKATDGDLLTNFRTAKLPNGLILTLGQSMIIRRVRIFTGQVTTVLYIMGILKYCNYNNIKDLRNLQEN